MAAISGIGDVPCITTNAFTDFMLTTRAIDNKFLRLSDIDFNFVATNSGIKDKNPLNPDRALIRF
jgi:hypothetical protein